MGLGAYPEDKGKGVKGAGARLALNEARKLLRDGIDPIEAREEKRRDGDSASMTVGQAFEGWIEEVKSSWLSRGMST